MESVRCNLCGSNQSQIIIKELPDLLLDHQDVKSNFVRCDACGLEYQTPRPEPAEILQHYPDEYETYITPEKPGRFQSQLSKALVKYGYLKRVRLIGQYFKGGRILDVGCATGTFLNVMGQAPEWETYGVEINDHAADIARQNFHLTVKTGTLEQAQFPDAYFEIVTLWDVLEHLPDPAASLREIARILKPNGMVMLRVPNGTSRDRSIFGADWIGWDAPRHFYVFNPQTLNQMLEKQGFSLVRQITRESAYLPFLLSLQFRWTRQHSLKNRKNWLHMLRSPFARLFLTPIFWIRSLFQQGPEMVIIARKIGGQG